MASTLQALKLRREPLKTKQIKFLVLELLLSYPMAFAP